MDREPQTFKDLYRLKRTSANGWFDGRIDFEPVERKSSQDIQPGDVSDIQILVTMYTYNETIRVFKRKSLYGTKHDNGSWSLYSEVLWTEEYSFESFKQSKWWDITLEAWKDGDCNSKLFSDPEVTIEEDSVCLSMNLENYYKDWLGNYRLAKSYSHFTIRIGFDGELNIEFKPDANMKQIQYFDNNIETMMEYLEIATKLSKLNVEIEDAVIKIPIPKEEN